MTDLLTYINVELLGLKPFSLNVFKTVLILLWLALAVWLLTSSKAVERASQWRGLLAQLPVAWYRHLAWIIGGVFTLFLIHLRVRQFFELQMGWDMTTEANVAWHMVHGPWFFNSLDNRSFLGGHFSPVYVLIGLFYRMAEHPLMLAVMQSLALGLGAVAVSYLSLLRLESRALSLLVAIFYVLNPYLHHSNAHDFHLSPLAIPVVLWLIVFIEVGRPVPAAVAALLALSIEESISPPLAGLGVYLAAFRRDWRLFGVVLAISSVAYFMTVTQLFMPSFNPDQGLYFWERYENLGDNINNAIKNILLHPFWALNEALVRHNQYIYVLYFLLPVALFPLFAWRELLLLVIPLSMMLLSQYDGQFKLGFHYSAPALPFLFYSAICGLASVVRWMDRHEVMNAEWKRLIPVSVLLLLALNTYRCPGYDVGQTDRQFATAAFEITSLVPADASVATDVRLAPLLINRHRICKTSLIRGKLCDWRQPGNVSREHSRPADPNWHPDYVVLGEEPGKALPHESERRKAFAKWLITDSAYREVKSQAGVRLFRSERLSKE